jgi:hypothetical protein
MEIEGKSGNILWTQASSRMQMISPLTIQTNSNPPRDLFFYRIQGIEANDIAISSNISHQVNILLLSLIII